MKNKCYKQSKLKKQLIQKREQGIKVLIWNLSPNKKREIEALGYRVEPYLYSIKTRTFYSLKDKSGLLKQLHHMKKNGKCYVVRTLNRNEKQTLDENEVNYHPIKYKIYL